MTCRTRSSAPERAAEVRPGLLRGGPSAVAAQILVIGYLVGFALSVADAVAALQAGSKDKTSAGDKPATALAGYLILLVLAITAAVITMQTCRRRLELSGEDLGLRANAATRRRAPVVALLYVALLAAAVGLTEAVLTLCQVGSSGVDAGISDGPVVLQVELFHAAIAGLVEEPVLLAVPIAIGRRCRWPWQATLGLMIGMRIAFHVYEGWNCLFVVPWIVGAFALYRWCSLLWPFVIAHGAFDVLQVLQSYGEHVTAVAAQTLLAVVVAVGALLGVVGCRRARLFDPARQEGAAATISAAATRNGRAGYRTLRRGMRTTRAATPARTTPSSRPVPAARQLRHARQPARTAVSLMSPNPSAVPLRVQLARERPCRRKRRPVPLRVRELPNNF